MESTPAQEFYQARTTEVQSGNIRRCQHEGQDYPTRGLSTSSTQRLWMGVLAYEEHRTHIKMAKGREAREAQRSGWP